MEKKNNRFSWFSPNKYIQLQALFSRERALGPPFCGETGLSTFDFVYARNPFEHQGQFAHDDVRNSQSSTKHDADEEMQRWNLLQNCGAALVEEVYGCFQRHLSS